jgi:hypothetical protein
MRESDLSHARVAVEPRGRRMRQWLHEVCAQTAKEDPMPAVIDRRMTVEFDGRLWTHEDRTQLRLDRGQCSSNLDGVHAVIRMLDI